MMKNVSESLAGRIGILNLLGLSLREIGGVKINKPFIPTEQYFNERKKDMAELEYKEICEIIYRGSMPEMHAYSDMDWQIFYGKFISWIQDLPHI